MSPKESIGDLGAEAAAEIVTAAADLALVVGHNGEIKDFACNKADLLSDLSDAKKWLGKNWADVVSQDSQSKVASLLADAANNPTYRWRQIYHPATSGPDIPILYSIIPIKKKKHLLALGREMRSVAAMQQSLVEAQLSIERDFARVRHAETRYRVLFQSASEPLLVVDATTDKVVEANPSFLRLAGQPEAKVVGRNIGSLVDAGSSRTLRTMAAAAKAGSRIEEPLRIRLAEDQREAFLSIFLFMQEAQAFYLLKVTPVSALESIEPNAKTNSQMLELLHRMPDGFVVVDEDGRIQSANKAFLQLVQLVTEDQAKGELLERWFGRSSVDVRVLIANVRRNKTVNQFATLFRGEYGLTEDVEISAAELDTGERLSFGLAIRNIGRRIKDLKQAVDQPPKSVEQLKELIGRVSLKEMVRQSTDLIERMCIEAALDLTRDNRATAAEMLGLSRQSLYVRLRRYGLAGAHEVAEQSQDQ